MGPFESIEIMILGTVSYMSPEQAEGRKLDARSDIFSLGSVLYEMVTGQKAFQSDSKMSTVAAILHREPRPVLEVSPVATRELDRIIGHCLRKDPLTTLSRHGGFQGRFGRVGGRIRLGPPNPETICGSAVSSAVALGDSCTLSS
jgi:serine/threonine protein kinase